MNILAMYTSTDEVIFAATKFCGVQDSHGHHIVPNYEEPVLLSRTEYSHRKGVRPTPDEAVSQCGEIYFSLRNDGWKFSHLIVATPSPFKTLNRNDPEYGSISYNPRLPDWSNQNIRTALYRELDRRCSGEALPKFLISSYQAAFAAGEFYTRYWNQQSGSDANFDKYKKKNSLLYVSLDVGINCSLIYNGTPFQTRMPPAIEHIPLTRHSADLRAPIFCSIGHSHDCVEGLLSTGAIQERWGISAATFEALDKHSPYFWIAANYAAQLLITLQSTFNPTRIVVGGKLPRHPSFLSLARMLSYEALDDPATTLLYPGVHDRASWREHVTPPMRWNSGVRGLLYLANPFVVEDIKSDNGIEGIRRDNGVHGKVGPTRQ